MHFPVYIHIGPWLVPPHPVFETLGCFVGARLYWLIRKKWKPLPAKQGFWILVGTLVGAGLGARLLAWLQDPVWLIHHLSDPTVWKSGETLVGALLGGLIGVEVAKKMVGWKASTGDAFVAPLIVGICIGRVGCFLQGLQDGTYGTPTNWFTGINFGDGVRRHPTQLYEIAFLLVLGAVLWGVTVRAKARATGGLEPRASAGATAGVIAGATTTVTDGGNNPAQYRGQVTAQGALPNGLLFQLFMTSYLGFRLAVEFIKPTPHIYFGLSNIQVACIFGLSYYLPKLMIQWRRHRWRQLVLEATHAQ